MRSEVWIALVGAVVDDEEGRRFRGCGRGWSVGRYPPERVSCLCFPGSCVCDLLGFCKDGRGGVGGLKAEGGFGYKEEGVPFLRGLKSGYLGGMSS